MNKFVDVVLSSYDYFQASQISTDPADRNGIDRSILYITKVIIILCLVLSFLHHFSSDMACLYHMKFYNVVE